MRYSFSAAALFAATVSADLCSYGSTDDNGNYYCKEVKAITYEGVGGSDSYNKVTSMDSTSGTCGSTPYGYSGSMSPLDEEVSMHVRGPINMKQFAVYMPTTSSANTYNKNKRSAHARRHAGHAHGHAHLHEEKRDAAVGDVVNAIIDGKAVSWINTYDGGAGSGSSSSSSAPAAAGYTPAGSSAAKAASYGSSSSSKSSTSSSSAKASSSSSSGSTSGSGWTRTGYYNAESQTSDGLTFLNHNGGSGSGVFDYTFGNSLSYASTDGCSGASSSQILADTTIPSNEEVVIMTDTKCTDSSCGFVRDGTVAYHGFDGASKAFFFEFEMPDDGKTASSIYDPVNMPAIWMLNAQIPRTLQYGNADCSCWKTGCGEFDIFEVLAAGDTRCKSTLHGNIAGGDSDYFARPTNGTIKAALLLYKDNIHIKVLDDSTTFGSTMGDTFVTEMIADTLEDSLSNLVSLFKLSS